jgi:hypothetical protein
MRWAKYIAHMGNIGFLVGKPQRRRPLGRHRFRLEDNIKMNLR